MVQHAGGLGGSAVSLGQLAADLQVRGHSPVVALARPCEALACYYRDRGINTIAAGGIACCDHSTVAPRPVWKPSTSIEIADLARRWRATGHEINRLADQTWADVVHLNSMPLMAAAAGLQQSGRPYVWHVREPAPDQGVRTRFIRRIMQRGPAGSLVFLSKYDAASWLGGNAAAAAAHILPNAVPDDWLIDRDGCTEPTAGDDVVTFAYLGGFSRIKGDALLLDALRRLCGRGRRWRCILWNTVYSRAERSRLSRVGALAAAAGVKTRFDRMHESFSRLGDHVDFRPFTSDIQAAMREAAFLVFPATVPHFPRPVIEAAACGRPAVATRLGGIEEVVIDGETGLLTDPGNGESLAAGIDRMLSDPPFRRGAGERALIRAHQVHRQSRLTDSILDIYGRTIAGTHANESLT